MFRKILIFTILAMSVVACSSSPSVSATSTAETLPVLVMDDAHFQSEKAVYEIPPGQGFILDTQGYKFQAPANAGPPPANTGPLVANYLQLVDVAKDGQFYGMEWQTEAARNAVTVDKLQPLSGTDPLNGFKSGQTIVVAVGNTTDGFFTPLWTATIEVK